MKTETMTIERYSVQVNSDMSNIEKYNYARKWLCMILERCQTGQKVSDFKLTWETQYCAVFRRKKSNV